MTRLLKSLILLVAAGLAAPAAWSTPPDHAPAHGWRAKQQPYYVGYHDYRWERDYGIRSGRCDRAEVGTVLGAVVGGAIGSTVGTGDSRVIAILTGAAIGALIGREIGRDMDRDDRACLGHALELGQRGERITWVGADPRLVYVVRPYEDFRRDQRDCRRFELVRTWDGREYRERHAACRYGDGDWRLVD